MTTQNRRHKQRLSLNTSRWAAYATAGAATALASAPNAEADITYVPVNTPFNAAPGQSVSASFALGAAGNSFGLAHSRTQFGANNAQSGGAFFLIYGAVSAAFNGFKQAQTAGVFFYVSKLDFGQFISANPFTQPPQGTATVQLGTLAVGQGFQNSQWQNAGSGYVGFRFNAGSGVQYGWARLDFGPVDPDPQTNNNNNFTLIEYAYGAPGESVFAGQIPEPGSLALLAVGALGLVAWRKRRAQSAAAEA